MTRADITIRQAEAADGPELLELIRVAMAVYAKNSGINTLLESQAETLEDITEHIRTDHVLVAENRGRLAGTVRLVFAGEGLAYFSRFAVLPVFHRSGVGKMLCEAAENWLRAQSVRKVRLYTALSNPPLVAFYESRGFRLTEKSTSRGYPRGTFEKEL